MKRLLKKLIPDTHPVRIIYHRSRNILTAFFEGFPAQRLIVTCITGTDGKTTTVAMLSHILHSCGKKTGAVSTAFFELNGVREPNPTQKTSVDARTLQRFLRRISDAGCTHAIVEASSHGLVQGRLLGITPTVTAITNVSMEHLDYHGTMDQYIAAKGIIFRAMKGLGTKVLNADDRTFAAFSGIPSRHTISYSPGRQLSSVKGDQKGCSAVVTIDGQPMPVFIPIPGIHNLENALCAVSCAQALGIEPRQSIAALESFAGAGGRMELIDAGQPFKVFIDFTVTPAAYEQTLRSAREICGDNGRLLVLTGSCGDRMKEKRPLVGELCGRMADVTIVTNEDPYTEDPEKIIDEVLGGVSKDIPHFTGIESAPNSDNQPSKFCVRISERLEAIRYILSLAKSGDVVLLCGKGADVTMMTKNGQIPWVEREIAREELRSIRL
ncbi:MAG: UDP-N-acetylmuramyl-tripeptide synthetase [Candidatus Peribacteraceae bacterium]|nr:UDP-N-acetylmuramyl-tripeptide synthetase [Candidatus Peribacteraceae bacterium]